MGILWGFCGDLRQVMGIFFDLVNVLDGLVRFVMVSLLLVVLDLTKKMTCSHQKSALNLPEKQSRAGRNGNLASKIQDDQAKRIDLKKAKDEVSNKQWLEFRGKTAGHHALSHLLPSFSEKFFHRKSPLKFQLSLKATLVNSSDQSTRIDHSSNTSGP